MKNLITLSGTIYLRPKIRDFIDQDNCRKMAFVEAKIGTKKDANCEVRSILRSEISKVFDMIIINQTSQCENNRRT